MDEQQLQKGISGMEAVGFVWDVLIAVAVPTTLLALGGRWLDERFHTSPWFVALGLFLSIGISYLLVSRKAQAYVKRMKQDAKTQP